MRPFDAWNNVCTTLSLRRSFQDAYEDTRLEYSERARNPLAIRNRYALAKYVASVARTVSCSSNYPEPVGQHIARFDGEKDVQQA